MGTAGARFMVAKQLAASGGLYLEEGDTRLAMDPGPGAVVQYTKRKVDLAKLDGILLSHRHLDHCGDVNVMIEAMTEGGFRPRGALLCPSDALDEDPVVLQYVREFPREVIRLQPETEYRVRSVAFSTTRRHVHGARRLPVETDGNAARREDRHTLRHRVVDRAHRRLRSRVVADHRRLGTSERGNLMPGL